MKMPLGPIYVSMSEPNTTDNPRLIYWFNPKTRKFLLFDAGITKWLTTAIHRHEWTSATYEDDMLDMLDCIVTYTELLDIAVIMGYL